MSQPRAGTVLEVVRAAEHYLRQRGVDAPRLSAELLAAHVLGMTRLELYLAHDRPMSAPERDRLRPLVGGRGQSRPLAYLLGEWEFCGLRLEVNEAVLVPRPETEHLVELAVERAPHGGRCIEIGTGSGAIAVALAARRGDVAVVASEVSAAAAAVARRNVSRHGLTARVTVVEGSFWTPLAAHAPFDLLVSNPPYVDPARDDLLAPAVRRFEPHVALFTAPGDPASAYRAIVAGAAAHLAAGAWLLFETGVEAAAPALAVLSAAHFLEEVALAQDMAGLPRYLVARIGVAPPPR